MTGRHLLATALGGAALGVGAMGLLALVEGRFEGGLAVAGWGATALAAALFVAACAVGVSAATAPRPLPARRTPAADVVPPGPSAAGPPGGAAPRPATSPAALPPREALVWWTAERRAEARARLDLPAAAPAGTPPTPPSARQEAASAALHAEWRARDTLARARATPGAGRAAFLTQVVALAERARAQAGLADDLDRASAATLLAAEALLALGRVDDATAHLTRLRDALERIEGPPRHLGLCLLRLAEAARGRGHADEARALEERAMAFLDRRPYAEPTDRRTADDPYPGVWP